VIIRWNPGTGAPRVVVGALVSIPKALVDVDRVKAELTFKNDVYWQTLSMGSSTEGMEPVYELWRETEEAILVPRHYMTQRTAREPVFGKRAPEYVDIRATSPKTRGVKHSIRLRDTTQEEASLALSGNDNDKIISLACGKGKTVVSLHAASVGRRFPLLIVVHTNALKGQWRANYDEHGDLVGGIQKFYGLRDDEIGHIQGPKSEWRGFKVAVAMLHTLVLKEFEAAFYRYWRLVIFDEVHRLGAGFFQKAAGMFPGERWGLSATVDREDKMDRIFRMHLGAVVYQDLEQPLTPDIHFVHTGLSVDMNAFMMRGGRVNLSRLQTSLSNHEKRNRLILAWIRKAYAKRRTILILGERLQQLHELAEALQAEGLDAAVYVGSMKEDARNEALRHRIVFATQHLAKEGLDAPAMDTLFILVPFGGKGRLQQSIGRILRTHPTKRSPRVFVFEDNIGIISALSRKMQRYMRSFGYEPTDIDAERAWKEVKR
jgi:superfamily II DNA or RNA helicase